MTRGKKLEPVQRTILTTSREVFKSVLIEQISKGKQLANTNIQTEEQLDSLEREFSLWDDYNGEFLKSTFNNPENEYKYNYVHSGSLIGVEDVIRGESIHNPNHRLKTLFERIDVKIYQLESLLGKAELMKSETEDIGRRQLSTLEMEINPVVFIIHGHDEEMKRNVQLFLNRGRLQDTVLHERPDKNRTVIEKLIEEGANASYVIALLSPDDLQNDGTVRARQNVILEIGYFMGKLGREKVRLLRRGDTIIPSDLQGILYDNYDIDGAWRIKLAKEIKAAGLSIDIENIIATF